MHEVFLMLHFGLLEDFTLRHYKLGFMAFLLQQIRLGASKERNYKQKL